MLKSEMQRDQQSGFYEWLNAEWYRCDTHRTTMENHAITYLMTTNGGGAAAVIAFAGSAGYATNSVYLTLGFFLVGLVLTGWGITIGMNFRSRNTRELGQDHRAFNDDKIRSRELEQKHHARFRRWGLGSLFGWAAWICFHVGIISSIYTFNEFMVAKQLKATQEKAAQERESREREAAKQHLSAPQGVHAPATAKEYPPPQNVRAKKSG